MRTARFLCVAGVCCIVSWAVNVSFLLRPTQHDESGGISTLPSLSNSLSKDVWKTLPTKNGYGVVYSAYSADTAKSLPHFLGEVSVSAQQLKSNNPQVSISLITNAGADQVANDIFDHIIPVTESLLFKTSSTRADGISRQWFTRLYYLAHSPYQITWYLDSQSAVPTTRLLEAFKAFERSNVDIATGNAQPNGFYCHNFALIFRWNTAVKHLFLEWMLNQLHRGIETDDQGPLCMALSCSSSGVRYGAISPEWALAWLSLNWGTNSEHWKHRTTQVFHQTPQICHSQDLCNLAANITQPSPHVAYMDSSVGPKSARILKTQHEIDKILPYKFTWRAFNSSKPLSGNAPLSPQDVVIPNRIKCMSASWSSVVEVVPLRKKLNGDQPANILQNEDLERCRKSLVTKPQKDVYGAWTFCESVVKLPSGRHVRPVIISIGIGTNMDWERTMIEEYGAMVYAFDPTPKSVNYVRQQKQKYANLLDEKNFVFEDVGLGTRDEVNATMELPENPLFVSGRVTHTSTNSDHAIQVRLVSLPSILKMHKLQKVDVIKWDIEGAEFSILDSLLDGNSPLGIPTRLLLLEWHGRFYKDSNPRMQERATKNLEAAGFVKIHVSRNKEEDVFFNTNI